MEDHETRRKIIRQWMALPKEKRQTAEQAAAFAKKAMEQNELQSKPDAAGDGRGQPPTGLGLRQTRSNGNRQAWGATS
jgi:hypothetical protein